jgi:FkbM family methyltransferase
MIKMQKSKNTGDIHLGKLAWYMNAYKNLGFTSLIRLQLLKQWIKLFGSYHPIILTSKYAQYPLVCRANTSDLAVFHQIFVGREYRCLDHINDPNLIIDCGANVGYSSAYMLTAFPNSTIIAIEPDEKNFGLLSTNLEPYSERVSLINSAVWSKSVGLVIEEESLGDGMEWGRTVREAASGESAMIKATNIGTLLEASGFDRISILKIDIEGAERTVFSENYTNWLAKVDTIVIELHGEECEQAFFGAIENQNFVISTCDELTVCDRRQVPAK